MKNIILLVVVVLLIPLVVISFKHHKTNFYLEKKKPDNFQIYLKDLDLTLDLNEYIVGVVGAEMPALFNDEAIKAQAIVSRTFALYQMKQRGFVTLGDQAYISTEDMKIKWNENFDKYYSKIKKAVSDTGNLCIYYQDELIKSYYFAVSSGSTEDSMIVFNEAYDYLVPVDSSFDRNTSKYYSTTTVMKSDFINALNITTLDSIEIIKDDQNYVNKLIVDAKEFSGIEIRKLFKLKSASFDIKLNNDQIIFNCYGYGHGVGMSQYGANELAKDNKMYQDIINYYYQNVEIKEYHV